MKRNEVRSFADEAYTILEDVKCEAAVERALEVMKKAPKDPESFLLMSEVAEENGHFEQVLNWLNRGLAHHKSHAGLLLKKASILIDAFEDIDEAFSILKKIEKTFVDLSLAQLKHRLGADLILDVYLLLTDCFRLKSEYQQAFTHALLAKEIAPFDESSLLALATAHFELGAYQKALSMIEPVDRRGEPSDFFWLKALILCADGGFKEADQAFLTAFKLDKSRYHKPARMDKHEFVTAFEQALMGLPKEIRDFLQTTAVEIKDVIPIDVIKNSQGHLAPTTCITIESVHSGYEGKGRIINLFQKNIENLASKKQEIKDLIASALLHELGKLAQEQDR